MFFPDIEVLKGFGIEAKLRARLTEAEEILAKLRRLALVNAKMAYQELGWGSRFAGPKTIDKQRLADEVDRVLTELGGSSELASMKEDYLRFAIHDVSQVFGAIVEIRARHYQVKIHEQIREIGNQDAEELERLQQEERSLGQPVRELAFGPLDVKDGKSFSDYGAALLKIGSRLANDEALRRFCDHIGDVIAGIGRSQKVTDSAADLIDTHSREAKEKLYRSIFHEPPPT